MAEAELAECVPVMPAVAYPSEIAWVPARVFGVIWGFWGLVSLVLFQPILLVVLGLPTHAVGVWLYLRDPYFDRVWMCELRARFKHTPALLPRPGLTYEV